MKQERLTEDLLERLLAAEAPEAYLGERDAVIDRALTDYLRELLADRGINRSELSRRSGVNITFVYDIFKGKSMPGRDNAIMLALGLSCDVRATQRLLRLAGVSELWPKRRRDAIILWCIEHGMTRVACDDELYRLGERPLFDPKDDADGGRA